MYKRLTACLLLAAITLLAAPTAFAADARGVPQFGAYSNGTYTLPSKAVVEEAQERAFGTAVSAPASEEGSVYRDPVADPIEYSYTSGFSQNPSTLHYGYDMAYVIGVDVTNQVVTVVAKGDSGNYDKIIRQFICSTGTKSDPTPLGTHYLDAGTRKDWAYFKTYKCYVRYPVRIYGNYFFHSLLYSKQDVDSLKTSSFNNLGKRASHGCIRMLDAEVQWISENCHEGTAVVVYEGKLNEELTKLLKP